MKRLLILVVLLTACAGRTPPPGSYREVGMAALRERMIEARLPVQSYSAEVRLTSFGPQGRVRVTGSLAVQRPASFRYEFQGPHGAVVQAFATNGTELALIDFAASRFLYGPATAYNINSLLAIAPMDLSAADWVSLLFGEVSVPADATLRYDEASAAFIVEWQAAAQRGRIEIDAVSARVRAMTLWDGETRLAQVTVKERDGRGLPSELSLSAPGQKSDVELRLRDVAYDVALDPSVFQLEPPSGMAPEYLSEPAKAAPK